MKVLSISKFLLLSFIIFWGSCESTYQTLQSPRTQKPTSNSLLLVDGQVPLPQSIKGVEFYRKEYLGSPPVIRLNTSDRLILKFDELSSLSGQFSVRFTHHNQDWTDSGLAEIWIFEGVNDQTILGGELNRQSRPNYYSYAYEFPNREIDFLVSGNYMITVSDYNSGTELFSLPFFVTENKGELQPTTETVFNAGPLGAAMDQLSGTYIYPDFIEFPQFDLSYQFAQNRFWVTAVAPNQTNFIQPGSTSFRTTRDQLFPAYPEFNTLDLRQLNLQNPQIFAYERAEIPEKVILRNDYFNFSSDVRTITETGFGRPINTILASYLSVEFRYETQGALPRNSEIYLVGDFNQWTISANYKLQFDSNLGLFTTTALVKQGLYNYSYAIVEDGEINILRNLESLNKKPQEYASFVYYTDPQLQYDRLLSTRIFYSE